MKKERHGRRKDRAIKNGFARHIVIGTVSLIVVMLCLVAFIGYRYVKSSLQPLNPNSNEKIEVKIPIGSTSRQIGAILEEKKVIKSGFAFGYYVDSHKQGSLKAGYYRFKPSMTLQEIATELQQGGSSHPFNSGKVLVREGANINDIAAQVAKNTRYSKKDFIEAVNNKKLIKKLEKRYPKLLSSAVKAKNVRYTLEGYLYPATYVANKHVSLNNLITQMVAKSDQEISPYYKQIKDKKWTVQEALSLAALVEGEGGVDEHDHAKIAGVFLNRIKAQMPLQSDVAIHYALRTSKQNISYKDLKVKSPYNLYVHKGYGPGPVDNPSVKSLQAVLHPLDRDKGYLYFVANMKTGKVYYSQTYAQHQQNVNKVQKANSSK